MRLFANGAPVSGSFGGGSEQPDLVLTHPAEQLGGEPLLAEEAEDRGGPVVARRIVGGAGEPVAARAVGDPFGMLAIGECGELAEPAGDHRPEGAAGREPQEHPRVAVVHLGQELAPLATDQQEHQDQRRHRAPQDEAAPADGEGRVSPVEPAGLAHAAVDRAEWTRPGDPAREPDLGDQRREGRHERQRDRQRGQDRERDREDELAEDEGRQPADHEERDHRGQVGGRRGDDRALDLGRPLVGRFVRVLVPFLAVAEDVLEHDDRVVDQHPHAKRESAQRHDVEGEIAHPHHDERGQDGERDRDPDHERLPERAEEEEHHEHREEGPDQRGVPDRSDRVLDEFGLVLDHLELDVAGHEPARRQVVQLSGHVLGDRDRVGVGLLPDRQLDGRNAVQPRPQPLLTVGVADGGDLGERDPLAALQVQRKRTDLIDADELAGRLPHHFALGRSDAARGHVLIPRPQGVDHLGDAQPVGPEPLLVQDHLDLALEAARHVD